MSTNTSKITSGRWKRAAGWVLGASALLGAAASARGATIELLPLGDAVTRGVGVVGGYRSELYRDLTAAGDSVKFDGSSDINLDPSFADHHEGHSGYRIDQVAANLLGDDGSSGNDGGFWLNAGVRPDYVLLTIGENDFTQGDNVAHAIDRLDNLLGEITAARPSAHVIVTDLLPRTDSATLQQQEDTYFNPYVQAVAAKHAGLGENVTFLDLRKLVPASDLSDGLHPNQDGYNLIGEAFYDTIRSTSVKGALPEPQGLAVVLLAFAPLIRRRISAGETR